MGVLLKLYYKNMLQVLMVAVAVVMTMTIIFKEHFFSNNCNDKRCEAQGEAPEEKATKTLTMG